MSQRVAVLCNWTAALKFLFQDIGNLYSFVV